MDWTDIQEEIMEDRDSEGGRYTDRILSLMINQRFEKIREMEVKFVWRENTVYVIEDFNVMQGFVVYEPIGITKQYVDEIEFLCQVIEYL
jgi:hypothetical protein